MKTELRVLLLLGTLTAAELGGAERGVLLTEVPVLDAAGEEITLYRESYALLIGISDYTNGWPDLPGVKDDLRAVKEALEHQGFQVVVREDLEQRGLEAAYEDFILRYGRKRDNRLLFYFAGHGHTVKPAWAADDPDEWMGYIVSREAPLPEQDFEGFRRNALSMQRFEELAKDIQSKHALFVFDSCFSGSVFALTRSRPPDITQRTARPVRQFITSGSADQEVPDVSIFRRQFVAALQGEADRGGDGYVTGSELGYFLTETVTNYSDGAQTPQSGKIRHRRLDKGDFVFVVDTGPPPPPRSSRAVSGHLQVNVNAPAEVYVSGEKVGEAAPGNPLNLRGLPAGSAEVRVQAMGYLAESRSTKIEPGRWTQLEVQLVPKPPASVLIPSTAPPKPIEQDTQSETGEAALSLTKVQRRRVQEALNTLGWDAGPADGVFGKQSRAALASYQRSLGVATSGYLTAEQLARLLSRREGQAPPHPVAGMNSTGTEPVTDMELVWVPEGCFEMGSADGDADERPVHEVCLKGFWLGSHEVTQGQWKRVTGDNPSWFKKGNDYPVGMVSWEDAQTFITKLNERSKLSGFRLPSEAEWEYACRSGGPVETYCGGEDIEPLAWYRGNANGSAHPVGRKQANGLGLYDMSGNVWEWVQDCYQDSYKGAPNDGSAWETSDRTERVVRGGGWSNGPWDLRSGLRFRSGPDDALNDGGFRLARTP